MTVIGLLLRAAAVEVFRSLGAKVGAALAAWWGPWAAPEPPAPAVDDGVCGALLRCTLLPDHDEPHAAPAVDTSGLREALDELTRATDRARGIYGNRVDTPHAAS